MSLEKKISHESTFRTNVNTKLEVEPEVISSGTFLLQEGIIRSCNYKFSDLLGYQIADIVNKLTLIDILDTNDYDRINLKLSQLVLVNNESLTESVQVKTSQQKLLKVGLVLSRTQSDNNPAVICSVFKQHNFKPLDVHLDYLIQGLSGIHQNAILTSRDGKLLFVTSDLSALLGYEDGELIGKGIEVFFDSCPAQVKFDDIKNFLNQKTSSLELIICKKAGGHILAEMTFCWIKNQSDSPEYILFIIKDISKKDQVLGNLRRDEFKYRSLFNRLNLAFVMLKITNTTEKRLADLKIIEVNRAFAELINVPVDELIGNRASVLFPEFLDRLKDDIIDLYVTKTGETSEHKFEYFAERINKWFSLTVYLSDEAYASVLINDVTAEKNAEKKVQDANKMLRTILDNIPQRVFWKDRDSKFLGCNIHFAKDYGFTEPEDLIGKCETDIQDRATAEHFIMTDKRVIETGKSVRITECEQYIKSTNKKIWVRLNKVPLKDDNNQVYGVVGTYEDISKQRSDEENLRKLSQAVEQSPAAIVITDLRGRIEYVNPKFCSVTGYSFPEVQGKNCSILKSGEMNSNEYKNLWEEITTGREWTGEFHNRKKNGELYWEKASISPIINSNGIITHYLAVKEDITERKRSEEIVRESERLLRETQAVARLGTYVFDISNNVWFSSPILDNIFGVDEKANHTLETWISILHTEFRESITNYFLKEVLEQHARFDKIYKIVRVSDGEERWVHGLGEVTYDSEDQPVKMIGTISDITERKKAEEKLKANETKFQTLFEAANDAIFLMNEKIFIDCNSKTELVFGCSKKDIINHSPLEFSPPYQPDGSLSADKAKKKIRDALKGEPQFFEWKHCRLNGSFFNAEVSLNRIELNGIYYLQAIVRDISERKQVEEELKYSFSLLEGTLESTVDGILVVDQNGIILRFNKKFLELWRISESIIQRKNYSKAFRFALSQLKYPDKFVNKVKELYKYSTDESIDLIEFKDGRIFERYSRPQLLNNQAVGRVWSFRDITDRIQAEKALIESEQKLRTLFETSVEGILASDIKGKNILVNPRMAEMLGYSVSELKEMDFNQLVPLDELEDHHAKMADREKGNSSIYERKLLRKNGELVWTMVSAGPLIDQNGSYQGSFGMFTDITKQKQNERELIEAKVKAEEMNRIKSIFLANISHELRTPLIGILGYAETLFNELEIPEFKEMAYTLLKSGERLKDTLNLILDLSHIEANKVSVALTPNNLNKLMLEKLKQFHLVAKDKNIRLRILLGKEDLIIGADTRMLSQVIEHLLSNAIKYTNHGEVVISLKREKEKDGEFAVLKISDTGIGISEENAKLIFEPFRQASEGLTRSFEGVGLGLTVAKKFVELMNGSITLHSELDKGSEFTIKFPIHQSKFISSLNQNSIGIENQVNKPQYKYSEKILLIEDDEPTANITRFYLSSTCKTDWAKNGIEAIRMAEKELYSVVLVDINLGAGMSGIDAITQIKKISGYQNVIFAAVTAYALYGDKEKFLSQGCDYYISKPFNKDELLKLIDKVLSE